VHAPDWPITTERLVLRRYREDDFEGLFAIERDAGVARWLYNEPLDEAQTRQLLARKLDGLLREEDDWVSSAVTLHDGTFVGDVAINWRSVKHRCAEIGFSFAPEHHGRGYATEAARALLPFVFETMDCHRLIGRTEARNSASARVLEKVGMRLEGHFVENEWVKGEWQSELVYAILKREWRP
jgi:RimJ/RimL family protein N-acetyltransferase